MSSRARQAITAADDRRRPPAAQQRPRRPEQRGAAEQHRVVVEHHARVDVGGEQPGRGQGEPGARALEHARAHPSQGKTAEASGQRLHEQQRLRAVVDAQQRRDHVVEQLHVVGQRVHAHHGVERRQAVGDQPVGLVEEAEVLRARAVVPVALGGLAKKTAAPSGEQRGQRPRRQRAPERRRVARPPGPAATRRRPRPAARAGRTRARAPTIISAPAAAASTASHGWSRDAARGRTRPAPRRASAPATSSGHASARRLPATRPDAAAPQQPPMAAVEGPRPRRLRRSLNQVS